jgi:hypothetical protein
MFGLGKFSNVIRSCSINSHTESITHYSYNDYGGSISHKTDNFKFGIRGGGFSINNINLVWVDSLDRSGLGEQTVESGAIHYINPFIAFDHKYIELSFGLLFLTEYPPYESITNKLINDGTTQFSWLIRIGNKRSFHFSSQYLSNVPLFSGGGMIDMGFGFSFGSRNSRTLSWVGLSVGPFQNTGLGLKQNIQVSKNFDILVKGRIGSNDSNLEGSISAGARYNF